MGGAIDNGARVIANGAGDASKRAAEQRGAGEGGCSTAP
jgi:hypothetical protein